jgi:arylsulfatase
MPDRPPNIVYILHDNTGSGDWGVYGGNVATPRIDKFASEGIRFNNYTVVSPAISPRSGLRAHEQDGQDSAGPGCS